MFVVCSGLIDVAMDRVNQNFMYQGDGMHNSAALLPELINDGVRLLVYAGNAGGCLQSLLTVRADIAY